MRILWVNPSFLDYRIPVYNELYHLTDGNFYILYSKNRVPDRINKKISEKIGDNAIAFKNEKRIILGKPGMANKCISFPIVKGLYNQIKTIKPELIIAEGFFQWTPFAIRYSIKYKIPILISYERTMHTERNCPKWRTYYRKFIDKYISAYLCNGILTKEYLHSLGINKNKCKIGGMSADSKGLVESCSNFTIEEKNNLKRALNLKSGLTYLYVGRLIPLKGVNYLLYAWIEHSQKYPNDNLLIVGGGELLDEFSKKFNNKYNIKFTGTIVYDNVYKYYSIADIFIIPTLEDNWSLVVPEAMSCGLAIACSKYNGCYPELVHKGENGIVFDPYVKEDLCNALEYFHSVNLSSFKKQSIEIEKNFNYKSVSQKIYNTCIDIYGKQ